MTVNCMLLRMWYDNAHRQCFAGRHCSQHPIRHTQSEAIAVPTCSLIRTNTPRHESAQSMHASTPAPTEHEHVDVQQLIHSVLTCSASACWLLFTTYGASHAVC